MRYLDEGVPDSDNSHRPLNPEFPLNFPRYQGASILLARETSAAAPVESMRLGDGRFRIQIGDSADFADIFRSNALKNGILPIALQAAQVDTLFAEVRAQEGYRLVIDLEACELILPNGDTWPFEVDPFRRDCLLKGSTILA